MSSTLFIDGQWQAAAEGGTRTIVCPADGTEVGVRSSPGDGCGRLSSNAATTSGPLRTSSSMR